LQVLRLRSEEQFEVALKQVLVLHHDIDVPTVSPDHRLGLLVAVL
jgi:hypothetical protein